MIDSVQAKASSAAASVPTGRRPRARSLTMTLSVSLALAVGLALALSILLALFEAQNRVRAECTSAMRLAHRMLHLADQTPPRLFGHQRVMTTVMAMGEFRHLRVDVSGLDGHIPAKVREALERRSHTDTPPPWWFSELMSRAALDITPLLIRGHPILGDISVVPEPRDETREVWQEIQILLVRDLLLVVVVSALVYALMRYSLRPLRALELAFHRVGQGDFQARAPEAVPSELQPICEGFNRTVADLRQIQQERQALAKQLVTLQEHERRNIARELHDELSPFLFCIRVDAATHLDPADPASPGEMHESFLAINDNVARIQERVRVLLHSLRPIDIDVHGWPEALSALLDAWRMRSDPPHFHLELADAGGEIEDVLRVSCYRIVQECVTNAVRHAAPRNVWVRLATEQTTGLPVLLRIEVSDDGRGLPEPFTEGRGISGMRERVQALGGTLAFHRRPGGGLSVVARLPV